MPPASDDDIDMRMLPASTTAQQHDSLRRTTIEATRTSIEETINQQVRRDSRGQRSRASKSDRNKQEQEQRIGELRKRIDAKTGYKRDPPSSRTNLNRDTFIIPEELMEILDADTLRWLLITCPWYKPNLVDDCFLRFNSVIAILLHINWDGWDNFDSLFLSKRETLSDANLPFVGEDALKFLHEPFRSLFYGEQFIFRPLVLQQGEHHEFIHEDSRLPIRSHGRFKGSKRVTRIELEKYSFRTSDLSKQDPNVRYFARKTFNKQQERKLFQSELWIHRELKQSQESLKEDKSIVFYECSFSHRDTLNILFEWADTDLFGLLTGTCEEFTSETHRFTPYNILHELQGIADGLDFLHSDAHKFMHLDLKPENILVYFFPPGHPRYSQHAAGWWKIADLGLSCEGTPRHDRGSHIPAPKRERSSVRAPRGPGSYQAPEMVPGQTVNRQTDLWSFGGITCDVLAFTLGQHEEFRVLHQNRQHRLPDGSQEDYFWTGNLPNISVKDGVLAWLDQLPEEEWVQDCKVLILKLLKVKRENRIPADETTRELAIIKNKTDGLPQRWTAKDAPPLPSPSLSSSTTTDRQRLSRGPQDLAGPISQASGSGLRHPNMSDIAVPRSRGRPEPTSFKDPPSLLSILFNRVTVPNGTFSAEFSADGSLAAFVSSTEVKIYDLFTLRKLEGWPDSTPEGTLQQRHQHSPGALPIAFYPDVGFQFRKILLEPPFIATWLMRPGSEEVSIAPASLQSKVLS